MYIKYYTRNSHGAKNRYNPLISVTHGTYLRARHMIIYIYKRQWAKPLIKKPVISGWTEEKKKKKRSMQKKKNVEI